MSFGLAKGQLSDAVGVLYTVPASTTTFAKTFVFHNTGAGTQVISISAVNNNVGAVGTPAASDVVFTFSLESGGTIEFSPAYPIVGTEANDTIQGFASIASEVNYIILGKEE